MGLALENSEDGKGRRKRGLSEAIFFNFKKKGGMGSGKGVVHYNAKKGEPPVMLNWCPFCGTDLRPFLPMIEDKEKK